MANSKEIQISESLRDLSDSLEDPMESVRSLIAKFETEKMNKAIEEAKMKEIVEKYYPVIKDAFENMKVLTLHMDKYKYTRQKKGRQDREYSTFLINRFISLKTCEIFIKIHNKIDIYYDMSME